MIAALLLAAVPVVYWGQPADTAPALRAAGIARLCAPASSVEAWRAAGFEATACEAAERSSWLSGRRTRSSERSWTQPAYLRLRLLRWVSVTVPTVSWS